MVVMPKAILPRRVDVLTDFASNGAMRKILAATLVVLSILQASPVWAGYDEGWAAYVRGDNASAIREWKPLAEAGHADAQGLLGTMYEEGRGVQPNDVEAAKWYRKAAEQGSADAQTDLGRFYMRGRGVPQDMNQALFWMRKGAAQGNTLSQFNLGNLYRLVFKKYKEAAKWYRLAADRGWSSAQLNLGQMYFYGQGVNQSYSDAINWLRKAAERGNSRGQYNLGILFEDGLGTPRDLIRAHKWYSLAARRSRRPNETDTITQALGEVERRMTPSQITEAQRLAREWTANFVQAKDPNAILSKHDAGQMFAMSELQWVTNVQALRARQLGDYRVAPTGEYTLYMRPDPSSGLIIVTPRYRPQNKTQPWKLDVTVIADTRVSSLFYRGLDEENVEGVIQKAMREMRPTYSVMGYMVRNKAEPPSIHFSIFRKKTYPTIDRLNATGRVCPTWGGKKTCVRQHKFGPN